MPDPTLFEQTCNVVGSNGFYRARIENNWTLVGPLGGYLAALTVRAVEHESRLGTPIGYHCQFLNPAAVGEAEIRVATLQSGARTEAFRVELLQAEKLILAGFVRTATGTDDGAAYNIPCPSFEPPETLPTVEELFGPFAPKLYRRIETRLLDRGKAWSNRTGEDGPTVRSWHRLRTQPRPSRFVDAARLLTLADLTPYRAAFWALRGGRSEFSLITTDLTLTFFGQANDNDLVLSAATSKGLLNGYCATDIEVWSADRRLLCCGSSVLLYRSKASGASAGATRLDGSK